MALSYSPIDIRGKAAEPIFAELFFKNKTIENQYVSFETDVKYGTVFTENTNSVTLQPFTCGLPTSVGTIGLTDTEIVPAKIMVYQEFCPDTLRPSRFNRDMAAGAWNTMSGEFERVVLATYSQEIAASAEVSFWNGVQSATTAVSIAALTGDTSTTERAKIAALAVSNASEFDGVLAKLVLAHKRIQVTATTITSSNIATEYAKLYAAMDSKLTDAAEAPVIFAPKSHKQLINIYNSNATYRDLFSKEADKLYYNGIEIRFVPLAENVMILCLPSTIVWCTDLLGDVNTVKVEKIAANREDMFLKVVFTLDSYIANQKFVTLYA